MTIILFRPFDLAKWCVIGFSAFLAGLLEGGNGISSSYTGNSFQQNKFHASTSNSGDLQHLHSQISQIFSSTGFWMVVFIIIALALVILAVSFLLIWLGVRGQFMFLDNIVRNRGAIVVPWRFYARQANSFFVVYLLFSLFFIALLLPILGVGVLMAIPLFHQNRWPVGGEIVGFAALGVIYLGVSLTLTVVLFLFREFGIPIMFRQGLLARPAFFAAMRLLGAYPGSVAVFILLRIAIFIGTAVICILICCFTCCIGMLPYIGTVLLLPVLIFVRCFTLDCLAQFGPAYDAFTVDVMPPVQEHGFGLNRPLPPG